MIVQVLLRNWSLTPLLVTTRSKDGVPPPPHQKSQTQVMWPQFPQNSTLFLACFHAPPRCTTFNPLFWCLYGKTSLRLQRLVLGTAHSLNSGGLYSGDLCNPQRTNYQRLWTKLPIARDLSSLCLESRDTSLAVLLHEGFCTSGVFKYLTVYCMLLINNIKLYIYFFFF